jgi:hypothetical protein
VIIVKYNVLSRKGNLVEKIHEAANIMDAVSFSKFVANTEHVVGKPVIDLVESEGVS